MDLLSLKRAGLFAACLALLVTMDISSLAADGEEGGPDAYYVPGPIKKLPNGGRPATKTPFPAITDWSTLKIELVRSVCFGTCPSYRVSIGGDGTVLYEGYEYVAVTGKHRAQIPIETVRALINEFATADFFWAFDHYTANVTDLPAYVMTLSYNGGKKSVSDYAGPAVGMPKEIVALEDAIDSTAGTARWIKGNGETMPSLQAENWDFHAQDDQHLALIRAAAERGNLALVREFLAAGVSARNKYGCEGLAEAVSRRPNPELADVLLGAGAPLFWDEPKEQDEQRRDYHLPCDVLAKAASGGNPEIVRSILTHHPDVNRPGPRKLTALMQAAGNGYGGGQEWRDYGAVIQLLIDAGADVNLRDENGDSALMMASDPKVVRTLLKAGAKDINTRNFMGLTPLMRAYDDDVAQALLEAGADPWMVDQDGKTALEICERTFGRDCGAAPVLERWMAAHPKSH